MKDKKIGESALIANHTIRALSPIYHYSLFLASRHHGRHILLGLCDRLDVKVLDQHLGNVR